MSKELEARKTLNKYRNRWYNEIDKEKVEIANAINTLLSYPTSEEVCKALSEHHKQEVVYDKKLKAFYTESPFKDDGYIEIARYYYMLKIVKIELPYQLELIELITKFYKGVIENK